MKVQERADRLIEEYGAAFEAANGMPRPSLCYHRGWYIMGPYGSRYRHEKLERMRDTLRKRAEPGVHTGSHEPQTP